MNEEFIGTSDEVNYIYQYLRLVRALRPVEMLVDQEAISISQMQKIAEPALDLGLFYDITNSASKSIKADYSDSFELIPYDRFYAAKASDPDLGGFHSPIAVGYQNIFRSGCAVILNEKMIQNKTLRTIEFARSYLHDSMHHSTYCSFRMLRRAPRSPSEAKKLVPEVYRHQYGFNFRDKKGMSFSGANLTNRVPYAINLNLLMDGVGIEVVADVLNRLNVSKLVKDLQPREKIILNDILLSVERSNPSEWGADFYFSVILPVKKFVEHWGGEFFSRLVVSSMFSGDLDEIKSYFADRIKEKNAWDRIFRSADYQEDQT
jgi:hypothetical protein